jgi:hypothetical protein
VTIVPIAADIVIAVGSCYAEKLFWEGIVFTGELCSFVSGFDLIV